MKPTRHLLTCCALVFLNHAFSAPTSGFFLPDSINELTMPYRIIRNLIVLPVNINDSVSVNLILDTGCRNLVLFGKRFKKLFKHNASRQVQFSGLGSGKPVFGYLSLLNRVSIGEVLGESIPIVIVPQKNVFSLYNDIDGVIGYDIFLKFEIELNPVLKTITFRPASKATPPSGYTRIPIRIVDSRPLVYSELVLNGKTIRKSDLMIDTGSSLGLLLKTTDKEEFAQGNQSVIGLGFNGPISGYHITAENLVLENLNFSNIPVGIIQSPWHNYASMGMEILKDYVLVLNYCKSYACLEKIKG